MKEIILRARGGIGNQLFQFAYCFIYIKGSNVNLKIDAISGYRNDKFKRKFRLNDIGLNIPTLNKYKCFFYLILYKLVVVFGLKFKYFNIIHGKLDKNQDRLNRNKKLYIEDLCQNLALTYSLDSDLKRFINNSWKPKGVENSLLIDLSQSRSVAIHIRRKDYESTLPLKFYIDAISLMNNKLIDPIFYIFSDDIPWCKISFKNMHRINFINSNDELLDLFLMKSSSNFIIANSTYSWWAAILSENEDKIIISPPKNLWFNENLCLDNFVIMPITNGNS